LDARLAALEATSKIDITPQSATADESRPTYKDDAVPDAHKVAAISDSREGEVRAKAASKIDNAAPVAIVDENRKVRRPVFSAPIEMLFLICF
jgi:hypothetical protein